jgi:hypothetical protein
MKDSFMPKTMEILEGNQAAVSVAYRLCDFVGVLDAGNEIVLMPSGLSAAMAGEGLPAPLEPVEAATPVAKGGEDE